MGRALDVYPARYSSWTTVAHAGMRDSRRRHLQLSGVNFLCLATAGVLVVVALTLVGPEPVGLFGDLKLVLQRFPYAVYAAMLVTIGLVADGVGFLAGLLGLLLRGHRRSWAVTGMALNALGFLPFVLLIILKHYEG